MYVFSDNSFGTLETTYSASSIAFGSSNRPLYIYGNCAFYVENTTILYADYVNNTAYTSVSCDITDVISNTTIGALATSTIACGKYIFAGTVYSNPHFAIFDMSLKTFISRGTCPVKKSGTGTYPAFKDPTTSLYLYCFTAASKHNAALTRYILGTPVTKTSANGMTVTYELEVFWE
jgi:hypothetical protein